MTLERNGIDRTLQIYHNVCVVIAKSTSKLLRGYMTPLRGPSDQCADGAIITLMSIWAANSYGLKDHVDFILASVNMWI